MAILKNGPNGGFSGKVGSIIGYSLNGQDIIKGWPKSRKKKPGKLEMANRDKFAAMQAWLQPLLYVLRIGFKNYAPTFQGFVAAKSYNSKHAFMLDAHGNYFIEPALARISFGSLPLPPNLRMELNGNEIVVTWDKEKHYDGLDLAMLVAYIPTTGYTELDLAAAKRTDCKATLKVPYGTAGDVVHVYIAFVAYDQNAQSNSQYVGKFVIE